jgi:PAS domain-containing protein
VILPSLILRLEQLPPRREAPAATETPSSVQPEAEPVADPPSPSSAQEPVAPSVRRTVDVAASERLNTATSLSRWSAAVAAAHDACFVLDISGAVISISVAGVELLGCGDSAVIGHHVLDVINLVDLETGGPNPSYASRITPLAVLEGPGLARSLMRLRHPDNTVVTLDSSSVPIHDVTAHLLGSVTFLAPIPAR